MEASPEAQAPHAIRAFMDWVAAHWPTSHAGRLALTIVLVGLLVGLIALAFLLPEVAGKTGFWAVFLGYLAIFISNAVACATIPTPGLSLVGQGLIGYYGATVDPISAGLVGGLAMAVGQIPNYAVGGVGLETARGRVAERPKLAAQIDHAVERVQQHGTKAIFLFSLIPNPFTLFADMAAGAAGMPFRRFWFSALGARLIRSLAVAFIGWWLGEKAFS